MHLSIYFVYFITFILAACSLVYEFLLAQAIAELIRNTVVVYCLTIGCYLGAMGAGALFCNRFFKEAFNLYSLFKVELWLTLTGSLSLIVVNLAHILSSHMALNMPSTEHSTVFFLFSFLMIIAIGFLTGLELPLLIRLGDGVGFSPPRTNRILACDYLGSLVAGLIFPLFLFPRFELLKISFFTAFVNLVVASGVLFYASCKENVELPGRKRTVKIINEGGICLLLFLFLVFVFKNSSLLEQYFLRKNYYYVKTKQLLDFFRPLAFMPQVERYKSFYQNIDIVRYPSSTNPYTSLLIGAYSTKYLKDPSHVRLQAIFLDGKLQVSSETEEFYHEYFAHIPVVLNEHIPQEVLVLGGGDGLLVRELIKYPSIEKITVVELDERMIELAKTHPVLTKMNNNAFRDTRVEIIVTDAYHFIRRCHKTYDAIYMDFPHPMDYNLSKLYSREFYHFVRQHLKEDGFAVLDAMNIGKFVKKKGEWRLSSQNPWRIYEKTLKAAGFKTSIPYVVQLEEDNEMAKKIIDGEIFSHLGIYELSPQRERKMDNIPEEEKDFIIRKIIHEQVSLLRQGFILAKKNEVKFNFTYKDYGLDLSVLNEIRFKLAFKFQPFFLIPESMKQADINSILRPRFPYFFQF